MDLVKQAEGYQLWIYFALPDDISPSFFWLYTVIFWLFRYFDLRRQCWYAGGTVQQDLYTVYRAPAFGKGIAADVMLVGQVFQIDLGIIADAVTALFVGIFLTQLFINRRQQNLPALQTVVLVLHALDARQQVVL